jgi:hypothetical protein
MIRERPLPTPSSRSECPFLGMFAAAAPGVEASRPPNGELLASSPRGESTVADIRCHGLASGVSGATMASRTAY